MKCETEGCDQLAEFYDPLENKLCSYCLKMEIEKECDQIENDINCWQTGKLANKNTAHINPEKEKEAKL